MLVEIGILSALLNCHFIFDTVFIHCESKKGATIVLSITSRNDGRFSKFFHC